MKKHKYYVAVSAILSSVMLPYFAQADEVKPDEIITDEVITVTASRVEQNLNTIAKSISVINEIEIERIDHNHVQQLLNRQAGVNFHRNSGQEYLAAIRSPVLTGAGACGGFLMLENGIPLRPSGFCNVNELFESHTEQAQRIEILRGPATAFFGSNGLHGVINVVEPAAFERADSVKLSLGEHEYTSLGLVLSNDSVAMAATIQHDGGFRDDSGYDQQKLSLQHQTQFDGGNLNTYFTVFNLDQDTAGYLIGKDSYKDEDLSKTNTNPEAYRKASGFRLSQQYQFDSGLVLKPYVRATEMEFLQHFLPGQPTESNDHVSVGLQSQYQFLLSNHSTVSIGFDNEYAKVNLLQYQLNATQGSRFLQETIPAGKQYDYSVNIFTSAPFVQLNTPINNNLTLVAGARIEYSRFDYTNKMNSGRVDEQGNTCGFGGCRYARPESRVDDFLILSPKVGVIYNISEQQSAFINISHGFRTPQATELYRLQREQKVADLDPEQLQGIEASWSLETDYLSLESNVYYFKKENVISRNTDYFNVSNGKTSHKGIELQLSKQLSDLVSFSTNGTYSVHKYENNPEISKQNIVGNDIDTAPRLLANAFLTYQSEQWWAELHALYSGEYFLDAENEYQYPGHFLLNVRMSHQLTEKASISFQLLNLADKRYAERADYTRFSNERYFPGEGRNVKFSIKYDFE